MRKWTQLVAFGAFSLFAGSVMAKDVTQDYAVSGWSCQGCGDKTVAAIKKVNGIKEAKADASKNTLTVTFDDEVIKTEAVAEEVKKVGYSCSMKKEEKKS